MITKQKVDIMKIVKIAVQGVRWEADDMGDVADIPTDVTLCVEIENDADNEDIADALEDELSNEYGFTHEGWESFKVVD